ncbi:glycosyltransferase family 2 protein [Pedobacter cryophilus]|uniref:Glycosyltransferase family 2 protein n=1 Tax=Pedobacter cryophilus TaxID=2571271 RepID=A0A4U1BZA3_9SPHI|nr:glycosyltransferase family 2 protein [Pedobacter cryophilus]TKB97861.1 glycosyltransferase family 2 protein [Pedobacter cryophilus]
MKLSIIIVSYNVRDLLQQALDSLIDSAEGFEYEIFVVDNASKDQTVEMIEAKYPTIKLIANQKNIGFSKANNQAILMAKGEYILVINPDTITSADTIPKVLSFMDTKEQAGGLGVRMINAQGKYLKESKRGLPTPWAAFTKFSGVSKVLPKSKFLNRYYMGWINEFETAEIEVLAGAFMLLRSKALKKTGLFDESFFMYGEDIDLSYRLTLAGYKNYYYSDTYIIHFKGQSTRKLSWRYIQSFYGAMYIFVRKYFLKF